VANNDVSRSEVKRICDELECSPSQHDSHGNQGSKHSVTVGGTAATTERTSEFKKTDRGKKISGYSGRFAKKAPGF